MSIILRRKTVANSNKLYISKSNIQFLSLSLTYLQRASIHFTFDAFKNRTYENEISVSLFTYRLKLIFIASIKYSVQLDFLLINVEFLKQCTNIKQGMNR